MNARDDQTSEFAREAEQGSQGMFGELFYFLKTSKKWWLTPILIALLLLGVLVVASGSIAAPFIYTLF
jgi:hypothetical protein